MTEPDNSTEKKQKSGRWFAWLLLLLLLLIFLIQWQLGRYSAAKLAELEKTQSMLVVDSTRMQDSLGNLIRVNDSLRQLRDSLLHADSLRVNDSLAAARGQDSLRFKKGQVSSQMDTLAVVKIETKRDSIPPTIELNPPPGRYFEKINLEILCNEPNCKVEYKLEPATEVRLYQKPLEVNVSSGFYFWATDSAGNISEPIYARYDREVGSNKCGRNMMPVPSGASEICMDMFEWPNQKGEKPLSFVSQEEAMAQCAGVSKRLCKIEEWQSACSGKSKLKYPYGNSYRPTACYTAVKEAGRSGRREQCRSYYGIFDLSGNLWEWTSTPYEKRTSFFYVAGGAWDTQDATGCSETKFSFYPQNKYQFVGFRCCADL
jgi:hypothetical protein